MKMSVGMSNKIDNQTVLKHEKSSVQFKQNPYMSDECDSTLINIYLQSHLKLFKPFFL